MFANFDDAGLSVITIIFGVIRIESAGGDTIKPVETLAELAVYVFGNGNFINCDPKLIFEINSIRYWQIL